jgi:hypothetical protein
MSYVKAAGPITYTAKEHDELVTGIVMCNNQLKREQAEVARLREALQSAYNAPDAIECQRILRAALVNSSEGM